ncbi:MAG: phosphatase PAP2 family protein [Simkaniaceae bacterium]|nr:phosphatase PAP2 family protein [Simkaniaceae bacterium]
MLIVALLSFIFFDTLAIEWVSSTIFFKHDIFWWINHVIELKTQCFIWAVYFCVTKQNKGRTAALNVLCSAFASIIVIYALKFTAGRARPELLLQSDLFGFFFFKLQNAYFSFPSSHSASIALTACGLGCLFQKWKWPLLGAAFILGFSRMMSGHHFPSDLIVGFYVAIKLHAMKLWDRAFTIYKRSSI